jgi:hypothetical protein
VKLMRRVCWDIDRLTRLHDALRAAEDSLKFAFKHDESFFEVVTVWRWSATRGYMHVDQAKAASRVFTGEKDGVRISNYSNVGKFLIGVWLCNGKIAFKIVGW